MYKGIPKCLSYVVLLNSLFQPFFNCFFRYESVVGTIAKKFKNKRKRQETSEDEVEEVETIEARAKRGFVKPKVKPSDEFEF